MSAAAAPSGLAIASVDKKRKLEQITPGRTTDQELWLKCQKAFSDQYFFASEFTLDYVAVFDSCRDELGDYDGGEVASYLEHWSKARVAEMRRVLKAPIGQIEKHLNKLPDLFERMSDHIEGILRKQEELAQTYDGIDKVVKVFADNIPILNEILKNIQNRRVDYRRYSREKIRIELEKYSENKTVTYPNLFDEEKPIVIDKSKENWEIEFIDLENFYESYCKCLDAHIKFLYKYNLALTKAKVLIEKGRIQLV